MDRPGACDRRSHWQFLAYDREVGLLSFRIADGKLSKSEAKTFAEQTKNVRADQIVFTLRSLVSSSLSFDGGESTKGAGSCTIAAAVKFVDGDQKPVPTKGVMERELLKALKQRYAAHGLDY